MASAVRAQWLMGLVESLCSGSGTDAIRICGVWGQWPMAEVD